MINKTQKKKMKTHIDNLYARAMVATGALTLLASGAHADIGADVEDLVDTAKTGAETVLGAVVIVLGMFILFKLVKRAANKV